MRVRGGGLAAGEVVRAQDVANECGLSSTNGPAGGCGFIARVSLGIGSLRKLWIAVLSTSLSSLRSSTLFVPAFLCLDDSIWRVRTGPVLLDK